MRITLRQALTKVITKALTPRALEHWDRNIGLGSRVGVHVYQCARHALSIVSPISSEADGWRG
jgi:hypothetical protein